MIEIGFEMVENELIEMGLLVEGESLYLLINLNLVYYVIVVICVYYLY